MIIKTIIIQCTRSSNSRNSLHSSKLSEFLLFNRSSIFLRFTAAELIRPLFPPLQSCSYHSNEENLENLEEPKSIPSLTSSVTPDAKWVNNPNNNHNNLTPITPRGSTPIGRQFESWIKSLQPGFKPEDVAHVLKQQNDPDLTYDIFRWTALQRNYRHNHQTYQIVIEAMASTQRRKKMEQLMEEIMAGACIGSVALFNTMISNYCQYRMLGSAIAVYKKMQKVPGCKPTVKTYNILFHAIVRRFGSFTVCCVHLRTVKSLYQQMNAAGVDPDLTTLNLLIKAHSMALEMDEAVRIYREMDLYGCSPDFYTYNYIIRGFCQKGYMKQALGFYGIMISKGLCPSRGVYDVLVCSLSVGGKVEEAMIALRDMTNNRLVPDFLTYKTLVEYLCRAGKGEEALEFLCGLRNKGYVLDEITYMRLVDIFKLIQ
ncbi:hypothetical protein SUGI_0999750 [Cryptomeria japonica]|uniref:pentatricopeptide repeat-containing protein At3g25210, mitochondrial n=1 Tax=Cryptomeria japonica TaxID=3369 RepID=UPI00241489BB|nr:pentatricopeptide repeat-containing protein At3g25210, mitochondrial [Cryptomeria japonica]GLJ47369.1 hypothetical protein SUGI_0999750 [Cryptomeria japonica]